MSRVLRTTLPDGFFHVISRGVDGCAIFPQPLGPAHLPRRSRHCTRAKIDDWTVYALCLMTTHYHLVLHSTRADLSRGVQRLNGRYAQRFNERHVRFGHLFADRFTSRVIETERHLREACHYVVENPVRARLCDGAKDWPWSYSLYTEGDEDI